MFAAHAIGPQYYKELRSLVAMWLQDYDNIAETLTMAEPDIESSAWTCEMINTRLVSIIERAGQPVISWTQFCQTFEKNPTIPGEFFHLIALGILFGYTVTVHQAFEGRYIRVSYMCQDSECRFSLADPQEATFQASSHPSRPILKSTPHRAGW